MLPPLRTNGPPRGVSLIEHFVEAAASPCWGCFTLRSSPQISSHSSGFAVVNHLDENPVAYDNAGLVPVTVTEVTCPMNQAAVPSTFRN